MDPHSSCRSKGQSCPTKKQVERLGQYRQERTAWDRVKDGLEARLSREVRGPPGLGREMASAPAQLA